MQNMNFDFEKEHEYLQITAFLVVSMGFGDDKNLGVSNNSVGNILLFKRKKILNTSLEKCL